MPVSSVNMHKDALTNTAISHQADFIFEGSGMKFFRLKQNETKELSVAEVSLNDWEEYSKGLETDVEGSHSDCLEERDSGLREAYLHLQEHVSRLEVERSRHKEEIEISHQQNLVLKEASEHLKREYDGFRLEFQKYVAENNEKIQAYHKIKKILKNLVGINGERFFRPEAAEFMGRLSKILEKLP